MKEIKERNWEENKFLQSLDHFKSKENWKGVKDTRATVFQNTVNLVRQGCYETDKGLVKLTEFPDTVANSKIYDYTKRVKAEKRDTPTQINVINEDCLIVGMNRKKEGLNPIILNMASATNPCGGATWGSIAQEEVISYRTNLFESLFQFHPIHKEYNLKGNENGSYPIKKFGGVYSPHVVLFREGEKSGYKLMDEPIELAFVSVAALKRPPLLDENTLPPHLIGDVLKKMRTIFRIALENGHDSIILGAWGCGVYQNPPKHIAKLFHRVIEEDEFKDRFKVIDFAILEDACSIRENNKRGNLKPFQEEFNT